MLTVEARHGGDWTADEYDEGVGSKYLSALANGTSDTGEQAEILPVILVFDLLHEIIDEIADVALTLAREFGPDWIQGGLNTNYNSTS